MEINKETKMVTVEGREYEYVVYNLIISDVVEQCKTCPLQLPFSSDVCLQCNHERIELEAGYDTSCQTVIYCPYCGCVNTDENSILMDLSQKTVFLLECRECNKSSTVILYDNSHTTVKGDVDE